jgi:predicted NAD/FAD-dependent oxidoreductase
MAAIGDTDPGFDVFWPDDDRIDAIFWQPGKPQREPGGRFVVHASPEWSERHLEDDPDDVSDALLAAFAEASGVEGKPSHSAVHRWRYARVLDTADEDFGLDTDSGFATCGDWHMGPRIEAAWLSGHRLGEALKAAF